MNLEDLPNTREEAIRLGYKFYFTGVACSNGHIDKRRTHNHSCNTCEKEARKRSNKSSDSFFIRKKHNKTKERLYHDNQIPQWADLGKIGEMIIKAKNDNNLLDHIVPLRGRKKGGITVCGLHCEDNLEILPYSENNKKSFNKWPDSW